MTEQRVSSRYAKAVFEIAKEQGIGESVLEDLKGVRRTISESREFRLFLENPVILPSIKKNVLKEAFGDKTGKLVMRLLEFLTDNGREVLIPSIAACYEKIYNEDAGILPVEITTARELNDLAKKNLTGRISAITGKTAVPEFSIDKNIIGGIKFKIDDKIFDTSVKMQLGKLFDSLLLAK